MFTARGVPSPFLGNRGAHIGPCRACGFGEGLRLFGAFYEHVQSARGGKGFGEFSGMPMPSPKGSEGSQKRKVGSGAQELDGFRETELATLHPSPHVGMKMITCSEPASSSPDAWRKGRCAGAERQRTVPSAGGASVSPYGRQRGAGEGGPSSTILTPKLVSPGS